MRKAKCGRFRSGLLGLGVACGALGFGCEDDDPAVMMDAINITQDRIARSRLAGDPPDITISPKVGSIGLFDFHRAGEAMTQGAKAAERQIDELKALVGGLVA